MIEKNEKSGRLSFSDISSSLTQRLDPKELHKIYKAAAEGFKTKIVVLDDDPTGIQTVHGVSVYTDCSYESFKKGFAEKRNMFFILTNSRSLTAEETEKYHTELCENLARAAIDCKKDFIIVSRSDSTLRGNYPLETEVIKKCLEKSLGMKFDGEVLYPFFPEGGRYTLHGTHYVKDEDILVPAAETDYAKDKTFHYSNSYLPDYIEEKTEGRFRSDGVTLIDIDEIRSGDIPGIEKKLEEVHDFGKICADSFDYDDTEVFCTALIAAHNSGKRFMYRVSAGLLKKIGNISDRALLKKEELIDKDSTNGGLIVIASHVKKTTEQFEALKECRDVEFICFDQHTVLVEGAIEKEAERVTAAAEKLISEGKTAVVYTRRDRVDINTGNKEDELIAAVKISDAVTSVVKNLKVRPSFLIAKGGITSSDIGTKALAVKRAEAVGQIRPGIPVWYTGKESKFPYLPYIIFPGNVGNKDTLLEIVNELI